MDERVQRIVDAWPPLTAGQKARLGAILQDAGRPGAIRPATAPVSGPGFVYRCYGASGELLYIGCATSVSTRMSMHRKSAPWFHLVTRTESERYSTREAAYLAESEAIRTEHPAHNKRVPSPEASERYAARHQ